MWRNWKIEWKWKKKKSISVVWCKTAWAAPNISLSLMKPMIWDKAFSSGMSLLKCHWHDIVTFFFSPKLYVTKLNILIKQCAIYQIQLLYFFPPKEKFRISITVFVCICVWVRFCYLSKTWNCLMRALPHHPRQYSNAKLFPLVLRCQFIGASWFLAVFWLFDYLIILNHVIAHLEDL